MLNRHKIYRSRAKQRGAAIVEFGIIAMLFFTLLMGIMEFGRVFYLYNTVQEITRCAARAAAVTWTGDWYKDESPIVPIPRQCLFGSDILVAGWEISDVNVHLRALNLAYGKANPGTRDENITNCTDNPAGTDCIRFVEASIVAKDSCDADGANCKPIDYRPMFGLIPLKVGIPISTVRMPAESLGY
jgi:hypothetical protein